MTINLKTHEAIFLYRLLENHIKGMDSELSKDIEMARGQLKLMEKVYGADENFDHESNELYKKVLNEDLPAFIERRKDMLSTIKGEIDSLYEVINEEDPKFIEDIDRDYFESTDGVKDLMNYIIKRQRHD